MDNNKTMPSVKLDELEGGIATLQGRLARQRQFSEIGPSDVECVLCALVGVLQYAKHLEDRIMQLEGQAPPESS